MKKIQKGFTLIELMIVVAIIGILAAVAIPAYQDYVIKAKLSKVQSTLDSVKLALAMYFQENGSFPQASLASTTPSAAGNLWASIGIADGMSPTLPAEVSLLTVDGTGGDAVSMILTIASGKIKAGSIDGLNLVLAGAAQGTAVTWACAPAGSAVVGTLATAGGGSTTINDNIAKKYFGCTP